MQSCSLPQPDINKDEVIKNLRSMGAHRSVQRLQQSGFTPQYLGNSDVMDGTVAVGLFLIESNGATDPNIYNWTQADQNHAISQVIEGLNWWVDQSRAFTLGRPLQFTLVPFMPTSAASQTPYEPALRPGSDSTFWINSLMSNFGATSGHTHDRVAAFNNRIRDENRAQWGFSIFMAYNPPPARPSFSDGLASWAYIGGPYTVILFRSFGWQISQLTSHETGHVFFACDEYFQPGYQTCSCSCAPSVRTEALNGNCQDTACNRNSTQCMMRTNEPALCPFTVAQIGWTSVVPRPAPTAPTGLVVTALSPTQVNLVWQDTATTEDGFQIERRGGTSADFNQIGVVSVDTTSFIDTTALANTAYAYRVRAFNNAGTSDFSSPASVITPTTAPVLTIETASLADATVNVPYSRTLVASGGGTAYSWLIESGQIPPGLSLSQSGTLSGTPTSAGTYNFVTRVSDGGNSATRALTLLVKPAAPLTITTSQLPRGSVGTSYSQSIGVSGGQTPYSFALQSGNLPDGLTLDQSTGSVSGSPERAGTSSFSIRVTDATSASVSATLSIIVNPAVIALTIETESLPDAVVGQNYNQTIRANGGNAPYRWQIISGRLPDGLQLSEDGRITGAATSPGESTFEVRASDQAGQSATAILEIEVEPTPQLTILTANSLPPAAIGVPYRVEMKATAGSEPYRWIKKKKKKKFGILPDGITLSPDGMLSGTPTAQGTFNFTVRVYDSTEKMASKPLTVEVGPPPPPLTILTEQLPQASQGLAYNARMEAGGGLPPYTWAIENGALPDGLTINEAGVITGRPTTIGSVSFTISVKDATGTTSAKQLFISIGLPPPPLVIQTVSLPETSAERAYSQRIQASGGVPPYTWSVASGSLGEGLNLSADGLISGTPVRAGTSVFVVRVTDAAQQSSTRTLAISIKPADNLAPFGALETPDHRATLNNTATGSGWALDNVAIGTIEVLVDNNKVAEAIYGLNRPDIGAVWGAFPNAGRSGFSFTFDTTRLSNGDHTLVVRLIDTSGNATVIGSRTIVLQNRVFSINTTELPRGRKGEPYSAQLAATNGRPPYTWTLTSGSLPAGVSMNASGLISGTPTVFGSFSFGVRAVDSSGAGAIANLAMTILPDVEPLRVISTGELTPGLTGIDYRHQLLFSGGRAPVTWGMNSGALPPGLALSSSGLISGRPIQVGAYTFTVRIVDHETQSATSNPLTIIVGMGPLGVINTGDQPNGQTGVNYTLQLLGTGGTAPYTWSLNGGQLPPGLSLTTGNGRITGKPTDVGSWIFTIKITDSLNGTAVSDTLRIAVQAGPLSVTTTGDLTGGQVSVDYSYQLQAAGGRPAYAWSLLSGSLPAGLTLDSATGAISGRPTAAGTFTFVVRVVDADNRNANSSTLRLVIAP
jgi:hypothetical protein